MENEKSVAIIIVNWNQKGRLAACLTSLHDKTAYTNYRAIVIDNGSADGSVQLIKEMFPWVDLIALNENTGFSVANNKGINYALIKFTPEYVLLLNNDTEIVQADWLGKMVTSAESQSDVGIVGCKLVYPDGKTQYIGTKASFKGLSWINPQSEHNLPETFDVDSVLGACFLIKREVIDKIGLLDVGFSPFVHEETDYCFRARKASYKSQMLLTVRVVHYFRVSVEKIGSVYAEFVVRRNFVRFMLLNFPIKWLIKRKAIEVRILVGCFVARNKWGLLPFELRTDEDLLVHLKIYIFSWFYNIERLREIIQKRQNREKRLPFRAIK